MNSVEVKFWQFKTGCYNHLKIFYESLMETTRKNPVIITEKNTIKKLKHTDDKRQQNT